MVEHMSTLGAALAAVGSTGHAKIPIVYLLMGGALIAVVALMAARRLWFIELVSTMIFFTLVGGSPIGRSIWDWLWTIGI